MYRINSEKGQALVIIALAAVGLVAFTALAIDGSRVFSDRRHAQNAADTAVLAAALAKIRTPDYPPNSPGDSDLAAKAAGLDRAASNGYTNDSDSIVEVHICDEVGLNPPCEGLPAGADASEYIQVKIISTIPTTFARIIGRQTVTSTLTAIARAKPGSDAPLFDGAALAAMSPTDPHAISGNGNFNLDIINSGLFDNSSDGCALSTSGAAGTYSVDTSFAVVGGYCTSGNPTLSSAPVPAAQLPYPPNISITAPSITCTGVGTLVGNTYTPGIYGALNIPNGTFTFENGNYCFNGGVTINGNTNVIANNANFLITAGEFRSNANGNFTCNNLLVHINGGTGMHFNGNGNINCNGVTFYASTGHVSFNGNSANVLSAPTSGTYDGLLIYLPFGNSSPLTINGNSSSQFTGSVIAVSSQVSINGNSSTLALSTQIIGHTVQLSGNGDIVISYDPSQQYSPGQPTLIQLTK